MMLCHHTECSVRRRAPNRDHNNNYCFSNDTDGNAPKGQSGRKCTRRCNSSNNAELNRAIDAGDFMLLKKLVLGGLGLNISVNEADSDGFTPLVRAAMQGQLEYLEILIKAGVDLNATSCKGKTALILAIDSQQLLSAEIMLKSGACVNAQDDQGNTALLTAVRNVTDMIIFELLIREGADVNVKECKSQNTALTMAVRVCTDMRIIRLLLESGADVNSRDVDGYTPLMWASSMGDCELIQCLIDFGAKVNLVGKYNVTALIIACVNEHRACVVQLAKAGADVNGTLQVASQKGCLPQIELLLQAGADVNESDEFGVTPLMEAASQGRSECVRHLIKEGADVNRLDRDGNSALVYSVMEGNRDCVSILLDAGADVNINYDSVPLLLAAALARPKCLQVLLESGADVNIVNRDGNTALMLAAYLGHVNCMKVLLAAGADVNVMDTGGNTALTCAQRKKRRKCLQLLDSASAELVIE